MATNRAVEIPTIDVALVTITVHGEADELALNTASKIGVAPQIETEDAMKLIKLGRLISQKLPVSTLTGNQLVLTDNTINPELLLILMGGTVIYDPQIPDRVIGYEPPPAGSSEKGAIFDTNVYTAVYDEAGLLVAYERTTYPNCQGTPFAPQAEDNVFRVAEHTINSAPKAGQPPYSTSWINPSELPSVPDPVPLDWSIPEPPPPSDVTLSSLAIAGADLVPSFDAGITTYTALAAQQTSTVSAAPTSQSAIATLLVNGVPLNNGGTANWNEGSNSLIITVTNEGYSIDYTVTVHYTATGLLKQLALSASGTEIPLSPSFDPLVNAYTVAHISTANVLVAFNTLSPDTVVDTVMYDGSEVPVTGDSATGYSALVPVSSNDNIIEIFIGVAGVDRNSYLISWT